MLYTLFFLGLLVGYLIAQSRLHREVARRSAAEAKLEQAPKLEEAFSSLSATALRNNTQSFLDLAKGDLHRRHEAIHGTLEKFEVQMGNLEKARLDAQGSLKQQLTQVAGMQRELQQETTRLASALRATTVRGRWGEIQLRRVVELAGMLAHCDFLEQVTSDDRKLRPDMVIKLPAGRQIVIDAKVPLDAYLQASESEDEEVRGKLFKNHADAVRQHVRLLASKDYASHFQPAPELVVLFLPGEIFFSAALSADPTLIEAGVDQGIVLATPTTLIALLRAISFGWRQQQLSEHAEQVCLVGRELHKRFGVLTTHWSKVGKSLTSAVSSFNEAVGSLEKRVLPKARELEQLGATSTKEQTLPLPIEVAPRP
jgi:DNA recombination protein RmuC